MLLLNSKSKTICILKQCIELYNDPIYFGSKYICLMILHNVFYDKYNKDMILSNKNDIDNFIKHYYEQIHNKDIIHSLTNGYFGSTLNKENQKKRIQFLKETIKQINKQYKNDKS